MEAHGAPGEVLPGQPCPAAHYAVKELSPVFPTGTRFFCQLKPGYPPFKANISTVHLVVERLCVLFEDATVRPFLNWAPLCERNRLTRDVLSLGWRGMMEYMYHLVGLDFSSFGFRGTLPDPLFNLSMVASLDVSKNYIEGR